MLEEIIDSSHKSALIGFLAAAPERSFTAKELGGRLRIPEATITGLLNGFSRLRLVTVFTKKSRRYYIANTKNKLFSDIRQAVQRTQRKYEDELFVTVRKLGQVKAAFLSGLFTGQPQLPVDILIVGKVNLHKLEKFLHDASRLMGQEINYSVMSADEFKLRYDTFDRFIKDIFDYPHVTIVDTIHTPALLPTTTTLIAREPRASRRTGVNTNKSKTSRGAKSYRKKQALKKRKKLRR